MIGGIMNNRTLLAALVAGGFAIATSGPVVAADLGGDCCADLEERVADLEATTVRKGNRKVSVKIYGQVARALMFWDNGRDNDVYNVDNDSSTTRIGLRGKAKINSNWEAGYRIEFGVHSAESDRVDEVNDDGDGSRIVLRRSALYIAKKGAHGKLKMEIGLASHGNDGVAKSDLGGTNDIGRNGGLRYIEDFRLFTTAGALAAGGLDWDRLFPGDLELDRDDVVRLEWSMPENGLGKVKLAASWGEDDEYSFGIFIGGKASSIKYDLRAGYGIDDEGPRTEIYNGSISFLETGTGLFVTVSGGVRERDNTNTEEEFYQLKGGIKQKWWSYGKTTLYGEFIETDIDTNGAAIGGEGEIYGFGIVQKIDAAAMTLYAGYREYEATSDIGEDLEDFRTIVTGAKIKF